MRNIIILIFIGLMVISCGSTKEVEVQKPAVDERLSKRESSDKPQRRADVDPEQLAAQLGLSDEKTDEFVNMWNSTAEKMRKVRIDYKDEDRNVRFAKMKEVKLERDAGIESILTSTQLSMFYQIMAKKRRKIPGKREGREGN